MGLEVNASGCLQILPPKRYQDVGKVSWWRGQICKNVDISELQRKGSSVRCTSKHQVVFANFFCSIFFQQTAWRNLSIAEEKLYRYYTAIFGPFRFSIILNRFIPPSSFNLCAVPPAERRKSQGAHASNSRVCRWLRNSSSSKGDLMQACYSSGTSIGQNIKSDISGILRICQSE